MESESTLLSAYMRAVATVEGTPAILREHADALDIATSEFYSADTVPSTEEIAAYAARIALAWTALSTVLAGALPRQW